MTGEGLGRATSLWLDGAPPTRSATATPAALAEGIRVEVAVIGAGIAGTTVAHELRQAGSTVALIDAGDVGSGVTGHTTAKVTAAHGLIYADLTERHGSEVAARYGAVNQQAIGHIIGTAAGLAVDCSLRRQDAYTYTTRDESREAVEREAQATADAGLRCRFIDSVPAPIGARAALVLPGQAEFNPIPYVRGLAARIPGDGSCLLTGTRVVDMVRGSHGSPCVLQTTRGDVVADQVVIASHVPIFDRRLYFARQVQQRSYAIAVRCERPLPAGMYLSIDTPTRSLRNHHDARGEIAVIAGEGHPAGHGEPTDARYHALAAWSRECLGPGEVTHHWSAQDPVSVDGLPFAGPADRSGARVFVITGLRKWGMTNGTAAALMVAGQVLGRDVPDGELFDPGRPRLRASARQLVAANARVARDFVGDRLHHAEVSDPEALAPGQAAVVRHHGHRVAAFRDDGGALHMRSAVCTHLGCLVRFNEAERSWDCPCHGSRYSVDGEVLEGPAIEPLAPIESGRESHQR